uniref:TPX2 domain-containing protein n=1 Tax=Mesocestoides corti TaxID=53468 RepID=A0A5K3G3U5_MESCO
FFRFQLAEELRYREALERDIRSQPSALQQFRIDKRNTERRKNQQFGENILVNRPTDAPSNNGGTCFLQTQFTLQPLNFTTGLLLRCFCRICPFAS